MLNCIVSLSTTKWSINVEPVQCKTHNLKKWNSIDLNTDWRALLFDQISVHDGSKNMQHKRFENCKTKQDAPSSNCCHTYYTNIVHIRVSYVQYLVYVLCVCNRTFNSHHQFKKKISLVFSLYFVRILPEILKPPTKFPHSIHHGLLRGWNECKSKIKWKGKILNQKLTE